MGDARRAVVAARGEKTEEFDALAHASHEHFPAARYLQGHLGDLRRPEVESLVERRHALENLVRGQVRVRQRRHLYATVGDESVDAAEPAIRLRLVVEEGAGVSRGERDLDRARIEFLCEFDGVLDGLVRLSWKTHDECAVDGDAELVAVLGELPRAVEPHTLFDVQQNLPVAALIADHEKAQAIVAHDLERFVRYVRLGIARPGDAELAKSARNFFGTIGQVGERVVVEEVFFHLWEVLFGERNLVHHVLWAADTIFVAADGLGPEAIGAARLAAPTSIDGVVRVFQVADEIVLDHEVALVHLRYERELVHVLDDGPFLVVDDLVARAIAQAVNVGERSALGDVSNSEVELGAADEIDGA